MTSDRRQHEVAPREPRAVLVLTQEADYTADVVIDELRRRNVPVFRVDSQNFPQRSTITGEMADDGFHAVLTGPTGPDVCLDDVGAVWLRRPRPFEFPDGMQVTTLQFARAEARQAYSGTLLTPDVLWMNEPRQESLANLKIVQLALATKLGLRIPRTIITNDPLRARTFIDSVPGHVIYKRMSPQMLWTGDGQVTAPNTVQLTDEALEHLMQVSVTPCCFQEYIEKAYEIRVTVVRDTVVGARTFSQLDEAGRVDWRAAGPDLPWEEYEVPRELANALRKFLRELGLVFGAFDLIRTPMGEYVFLECNAAGQWAWFDPHITDRIRDAIVDTLSAGRAAASTQPLDASTTAATRAQALNLSAAQ